MTTEKTNKNEKKYICDLCDYISFKKTDYNRHLLTSKHLKLQNTTFSSEKNENLEYKRFLCECGKKYKHHSSLWSHKKKCNFLYENNNSNDNSNDNSNNINNQLSIINENTIIDELKNIIIKQQSQIDKQQEQLSELIPKIGNNITNNTQNNKFNINVFLNEKCKDAINMTDFVKSIEVSLQQLDFTKKNGLANGLSKTIMDNINKLSLYERPLHCTDVKRETLYIKDENEWSKDANKEKIKKAIKKASGKNYNALQDWKTENPDFLINDSKTDYFTKTITVIGKSGDATEDKIIKNLCKETYIKDSIE
tara:strand:+ start:966 stop:1892 length:927 start_codon:yes stop_codon:yes gene_type:complete